MIMIFSPNMGFTRLLGKKLLLLFALCSAIDSFSNPEVLSVITKTRQEEIWLHPFSEPPNSRGSLAPLAPPLSRPRQCVPMIESNNDPPEITSFHWGESKRISWAGGCKAKKLPLEIRKWSLSPLCFPLHKNKEGRGRRKKMSCDPDFYH